MPSPSRLASPIFIVASPDADADAEVLLRSFARADGVWTPRARDGSFLDDVASGALTAGDASARAHAAHEALLAGLIDREERSPDQTEGPVLAVAAGRRVSECVAFLAAAFADARFLAVVGDETEGAPAGLAELPAERRWRITREQLLADPRAELKRLCLVSGIAYDQALLTPVEEARRARVASGGGEEAFASVSTTSFGEVLAHLGSSLVISTYQSHKLVIAREQGGTLNTHFREFDKPMGIAVAPGRIALGTRSEVWDLRDMPEAAQKLDPPGTHDACYLPRNRHITGDIAVHDLAFAGGQLWLVATAFSCLATLDADHSFIPRWTPPFITELAPGDRCHLNGMAVVGERVAYVTALGQTDEPGGWRAGRATDGVLIDVASSQVVVGGLSMPHSPRWHDGRLWLLESGEGTLCTVDLASGRVEAVAELPGFTRGLAFAGGMAFVGLSQIRESSTFGGLPLTSRLRERLSGVWMVDVRSGAIAGFLRFDDLVQEIFDVALLPGKRFPEVAEATGETTALSYVVP